MIKTKKIRWDSDNSIMSIAYCGKVRIGHTVVLFSRFGTREHLQAATVFSEKEYEAKSKSEARSWVESQWQTFINNISEEEV